MYLLKEHFLHFFFFLFSLDFVCLSILLSVSIIVNKRGLISFITCKIYWLIIIEHKQVWQLVFSWFRYLCHDQPLLLVCDGWRSPYYAFIHLYTYTFFWAVLQDCCITKQCFCASASCTSSDLLLPANMCNNIVTV